MVDFKCDYAEAAWSISGLEVECRPGGCVHYGKCLPVSGIRETPEHALMVKEPICDNWQDEEVR